MTFNTRHILFHRRNIEVIGGPGLKIATVNDFDAVNKMALKFP